MGFYARSDHQRYLPTTYTTSIEWAISQSWTHNSKGTTSTSESVLPSLNTITHSKHCVPCPNPRRRWLVVITNHILLPLANHSLSLMFLVVSFIPHILPIHIIPHCNFLLLSENPGSCTRLKYTHLHITYHTNTLIRYSLSLIVP